MGKVNQQLALKELADFTRRDIKEWRASIRAEVMQYIAVAYADSPYSHIARLDPVWIDNALQDALADATHDAWLKMEEE